MSSIHNRNWRYAFANLCSYEKIVRIDRDAGNVLHFTSKRHLHFWIMLHRSCATHTVVLSADPWYAETISPINRARRVARQTGSRGLGFAHNERHDANRPTDRSVNRLVGRPADHVIGERWRTRARTWCVGWKFCGVGLVENACEIVSRLRGKSRNRRDWGDLLQQAD